ncbi:uncharacterized protein LOC105427300 isoform X1 [Pogonomyrmex barbatus]|uniref:Uncharacterized protein LOC105427300 isoform X1 n=1 Tax=Pogonomyrmex barbatus TaxID=144034 RepID=A0A6I9WDX1_9HYME|nr:uncharacterized protein LOC105427300 isoform X1 [Pogonomyrmex barbatus]
MLAPVRGFYTRDKYICRRLRILRPVCSCNGKSAYTSTKPNNEVIANMDNVFEDWLNVTDRILEYKPVTDIVKSDGLKYNNTETQQPVVINKIDNKLDDKQEKQGTVREMQKAVDDIVEPKKIKQL